MPNLPDLNFSAHREDVPAAGPPQPRPSLPVPPSAQPLNTAPAPLHGEPSVYPETTVTWSPDFCSYTLHLQGEKFSVTPVKATEEESGDAEPDSDVFTMVAVRNKINREAPTVYLAYGLDYVLAPRLNQILIDLDLPRTKVSIGDRIVTCPVLEAHLMQDGSPVPMTEEELKQQEALSEAQLAAFNEELKRRQQIVPFSSQDAYVGAPLMTDTCNSDYGLYSSRDLAPTELGLEMEKRRLTMEEDGRLPTDFSDHVFCLITYKLDTLCLNVCVATIRECVPHAKIAIFDDANNPVGLENCPPGCLYFQTKFNRGGNLKGIECLNGIITCFQMAAQHTGSRFVVKIDADTYIKNLSYLLEGKNFMLEGFNMYYGSGCCYKLDVRNLETIRHYLNTKNHYDPAALPEDWTITGAAAYLLGPKEVVIHANRDNYMFGIMALDDQHVMTQLMYAKMCLHVGQKLAVDPMITYAGISYRDAVAKVMCRIWKLTHRNQDFVPVYNKDCRVDEQGKLVWVPPTDAKSS